MIRNNKYRDIKVKKLPPKEISTLLADNKEIQLIDVRPEKFTKGPNFISGSENLPLLNITNRISELDRERPIILTDWAMRQSPLAAKYLQAHGYNVLGVLKGGLIRWDDEGYPVEIRKVENK